VPEEPTYDDFVRISNDIMKGRNSVQQREVVREVLLSLMPKGTPEGFRCAAAAGALGQHPSQHPATCNVLSCRCAHCCVACTLDVDGATAASSFFAASQDAVPADPVLRRVQCPHCLAGLLLARGGERSAHGGRGGEPATRSSRLWRASALRRQAREPRHRHKLPSAMHPRILSMLSQHGLVGFHLLGSPRRVSPSVLQVGPDGAVRRQRSVVHIKKCRYLEASGCVGLCTNLCKVRARRCAGVQWSAEKWAGRLS
jgi:hypothetical protein